MFVLWEMICLFGSVATAARDLRADYIDRHVVAAVP
jgi:hypothetical protein